MFRTNAARVTPSGVVALAPRNEADSVTIPPSASRAADLFFPLPAGEDLPDAALDELVVSWIVEIGGREHRNEARFRRTREYYSPYRYRPYYWYPGHWHYPWGARIHFGFGHFYRCY